MHWREAERAFADDVVARETLPRTFERSTERNADRTAQRYEGGIYGRSLVAEGVLPAAPDGGYADVTYAEMRGIVRRLAAGFRERAKGLLVLSTEKNVAPGPIEDRFAANEFVEGCVVLGDGRKFVSALIVPNFERVATWADARGVDLPDDRKAICRDERVRGRTEEVGRVNEAFEPYERIKRFRLVEEEFTEANDLFTPTMKKKRRNSLDRFADDVEMIYAE